MWGVALPYVQTIAASGAITWQNPTKFQFVAPGLDLMYWMYPPTDTAIPANNTLRNIAVPNTLSQGDLDNLSNFTTGVISP
jgi:hypothetical protein